ncbi:hypothetical protein N5853_11515 [Bartonella sp. HY329]|uniref:hypothetical protein n=1 Tax=unclassified Bartonella TaxID=2645622 RepID=UPI0021C9820D|nr:MULTISPECIES: hypothetical protein [unclassified Bartonella]UXM94715.1 hypothetical protein N5853_11515 [Bartonella sp. HY329]UXN09038.1 hypothetical protein N5852_11525 [Bartonella sp. HY328]
MTSDQNNNSPSSIYQTKPKKKSFLAQPVFWLILLVLILIVIAGFLVADKFGGSATQSQPAAVDPQANHTTTLINNEFAKQAQDVGAKKCAALFSNLGDAVISGSTYDAIYTGSQQSADENPIGALIGQVYTSTNGRGTGVVFAAPTANGCAGVLTRTILQMQSCGEIAQQLPAGSERLKDLTATAVFKLPNNFSVMLMPASETSCVIVTSLNLSEKK